MKIFFDVQHLYYLAQYIPVYEELQRRNIPCHFVFHSSAAPEAFTESIIAAENLPASILPDTEVLPAYVAEKPDWIVFGNACGFLDKLAPSTRTALLYHGIGVKACYYDAELAMMNVRFVEGPYRLAELKKRSPLGNYVVTGFAKLDPFFGQETPPPDPGSQKTVLYAPTFYPSSLELLDDCWPEELGECRLLVKPHFFTLTGKGYAAQRRKLEKWARHANVQVAGISDYSLVPFMAQADLLVSEASSALFEFAALDRPVVWLDFFRLRWSYRGPLRYRFTRRMDGTIMQYADIAAHAAKPKQAAKVILQQLAQPSQYSETRKRYTRELLGLPDGKASERIADYLIT